MAFSPVKAPWKATSSWSLAGVPQSTSFGNTDPFSVAEVGTKAYVLGYATDYANGVVAEPTPVAELVRLIGASTDAVGRTLAAAVPRLGGASVAPTGSHFRFD